MTECWLGGNPASFRLRSHPDIWTLLLADDGNGMAQCWHCSVQESTMASPNFVRWRTRVDSFHIS